MILALRKDVQPKYRFDRAEIQRARADTRAALGSDLFEFLKQVAREVHEIFELHLLSAR